MCPPKLRCGVFTSAAVDNIDYNPTSSTAKDSFHGTGISLIQHLSSVSEGHDQSVQIINQSASNTSRSIALPLHYTNVPPASIKTKEFTAPVVGSSPIRPTTLLNVEKAKEGETEWLNKVMAVFTKEKLDGMDWISWSAYHASIQKIEILPAAINALLPIFMDSAHSIAMINDYCSSSRSTSQRRPGSRSYCRSATVRPC